MFCAICPLLHCSIRFQKCKDRAFPYILPCLTILLYCSTYRLFLLPLLLFLVRQRELMTGDLPVKSYVCSKWMHMLATIPKNLIWKLVASHRHHDWNPWVRILRSETKTGKWLMLCICSALTMTNCTLNSYNKLFLFVVFLRVKICSTVDLKLWKPECIYFCLYVLRYCMRMNVELEFSTWGLTMQTWMYLIVFVCQKKY